MISIKNLSCSFSKKFILKDISLELQSHVTVLGANGSGKSTFAKALCGLNKYEGEIYIAKQNLQNLSLVQRAKTIAYIPTKLEVYDKYITVEEFVLLSRFAYKKSYLDYTQKDRDLVEKNLNFLAITHLKHHTMEALSSGEQQLVLIASALTQQSDVIIFDEPTANLDPLNSKVIAQHIKTLKKQHQIILITHDLHLAHYIDSEVLFVKNSSIEHYKEGIFTDAMLQKLYGVKFTNLVVEYA